MSVNPPTFTAQSVTDLIDLDRYPMADLTTSAGQKFVAECAARLQETGSCNLPGFLKPEAAAAMAAQGLELTPQAFRDVSRHNVYFTAEDPSLPEDHPAYFSQRTAKTVIPYDLIPEDAPIRQLYNWPPMREFVAAVLGLELYLHGDPMGAMIMFSYGEGDELGWHFDHAEFVTTLVLQEPEGGGIFEYVRLLRDPDNENISGIADLISGKNDDVIRLSGEAGTLNLFVGHYSIHRVTPVEGPRPRVIAVLSYQEESGVKFTSDEQIRFYGRAV